MEKYYHRRFYSVLAKVPRRWTAWANDVFEAPTIKQPAVCGTLAGGLRCYLLPVTAPTARRYLKEIDLLSIGLLAKGCPETNQPDTIALADQSHWLKLEP